MRDDGDFFKSVQDATKVIEANVLNLFGQIQNVACLLSMRTVSGEKCSEEVRKAGEIILCRNTIILAHIPKFWSSVDIFNSRSTGT